MTDFKRHQRNWKGKNTTRFDGDWGTCLHCGQPLHKGNTRGHDRKRMGINSTCGRCYLKHKAEERERRGLP